MDDPTHHLATTTEALLGDAWRAERGRSVALATRMLRDPGEAEDVVQEVFDRLARLEIAEIEDVRAWLAVAVRRRCLDRIKSSRNRHEAVGRTGDDAVGDPVHGGAAADPSDRTTLDEQVQHALALVLDRLTPGERTTFVLHDVFGFSFVEVGEIVGRTPAACRQLASRARRAIRLDEPRGVAHERGADDLVAERFIAACAGGDLGELLAVLDPEVAGEATLLGAGPITAQSGRVHVAGRLLALFGPTTGRRLLPVPLEGSPGLVAMDGANVVAVVRLEVVDGLVHHIRSYVHPPRRRVPPPAAEVSTQ
jgi:RNA polymerase sigma-70 factor (ECF subfamily)